MNSVQPLLLRAGDQRWMCFTVVVLLRRVVFLDTGKPPTLHSPPCQRERSRCNAQGSSGSGAPFEGQEAGRCMATSFEIAWNNASQLLHLAPKELRRRRW